MEIVLQKISEASQITVSRIDCAVEFQGQTDFKVTQLGEGFEWIVQADDKRGSYSVLMKFNGDEIFDAGLHVSGNSSIMFSCGERYFRVYFGSGVSP